MRNLRRKKYFLKIFKFSLIQTLNSYVDHALLSRTVLFKIRKKVNNVKSSNSKFRNNKG